MIGSRGLSVRHSGLEAHVRELADQLGVWGNDVSVYGRRNHGRSAVSREPLPETCVEDKEGLCFKGKLTATVSSSLWATVDAIRSRRFDILHYHGVGCVFGLVLARMWRIPAVLSLHSTNWQENKWSRISRYLIHRLEKLAVRTANAVIVVSSALAHRIEAEYGVIPHVIPNGVCSKGSIECDDGVLRSLGLDMQRYVLYVGRIVPDKGCHVLLEAIREAGIPMKLALIGPHQDKAYATSLLVGNRDLVVAPGMLQDPELGALYRSCWVFCSASVSEGQSRVVLEALAHGARCVVSDIPGHQELVTDPEMRFAANGVSDLRDRLVSLHEAKEPTIGGDCLHWLEQHPEYTISNTARRVLDVYRHTLTSRQARSQ